MAKIYLDKYYTKKVVAEKCLAMIPDFDSYDTFIEPSAGLLHLLRFCLIKPIWTAPQRLP
jgi:hypothetical protein